MRPLLEPGNYNFTYNQEYLLTKLFSLDIYANLFWGFWFAVFLGIAVYVVIKIIRNKNLQEKEERQEKQNYLKQQEQEKVERFKQQEKDEVFSQFHEICRLMYEDLHVFKRPQKMVRQMYYHELKDLIQKMSRMEAYMRKNYKHLIPDYEFYRDKFIEEEKNGIE